MIIYRSVLVAFGVALQSGNCPENLALEFCEDNLTTSEVKPIFEALNSGKAPRKLYLNFTGNKIDNDGVSMFADALESGQAPENLSIALINNPIDKKGIKRLAQATTHMFCPNSVLFSIDIHDVQSTKSITDALLSHQCRTGLSMNLYFPEADNNDESTWWEESARCFENALSSGNCPENFSLGFFQSRQINRYTIAALTNALISGNCPEGFKAFITYDQSVENDANMLKLFDTLRSGKCPNKLSLDIFGWDVRNKDLIKSLAEALESKNCPKQLTIRLSCFTPDEEDQNRLANALLVNSNVEIQGVVSTNMRLQIYILRNDLIRKYPEHRETILMLAAKRGFYKPSSELQQNPSSLKTQVGMFFLNNMRKDQSNETISKKVEQLNLPKDIKDFIVELDSLDHQLHAKTQTAQKKVV